MFVGFSSFFDAMESWSVRARTGEEGVEEFLCYHSGEPSEIVTLLLIIPVCL